MNLRVLDVLVLAGWRTPNIISPSCEIPGLGVSQSVVMVIATVQTKARSSGIVGMVTSRRPTCAPYTSAVLQRATRPASRH